MKRIPVLFENKRCMVLLKPAGLSVQGGEGVGASLDSILRESFSYRPLLVHRLDRDTSGLILVAKDHDSAAAFSALFAGRAVRKQYLAVTRGVPPAPWPVGQGTGNGEVSGTIRLALDVKGRAKTSETSWKLLGKAENSAFSLLELELGTGRMHQIRRHLKSMEHPILGDDKYGDFALNREFRKPPYGLKRLLLHAARLVVPPLADFLPDGLDTKAPLPDYFDPFISQLDNGPVFYQ